MSRMGDRPIMGERSRRRARRPREPLDVHLTVAFRFGDAPEECVTMIDNRKVPLVDSVFDNRDRIMRSFVLLLIRAGLTQPKVITEIVPALRLLKRRGGGD